MNKCVPGQWVGYAFFFYPYFIYHILLILFHVADT